MVRLLLDRLGPWVDQPCHATRAFPATARLCGRRPGLLVNHYTADAGVTALPPAHVLTSMIVREADGTSRDSTHSFPIDATRRAVGSSVIESRRTPTSPTADLYPFSARSAVRREAAADPETSAAEPETSDPIRKLPRSAVRREAAAMPPATLGGGASPPRAIATQVVDVDLEAMARPVLAQMWLGWAQSRRRCGTG